VRHLGETAPSEFTLSCTMINFISRNITLWVENIGAEFLEIRAPFCEREKSGV
jgi:hypothetical protein